jgi:predicted HAD superfamily Cof-like phosphohydrolase
MKQQLKAVEDFHNMFLQEMGTEPRLLTDKESQLRFNLMDEENKEYLQACEENDLVGIADALGDQLYILCGTILKHGMQHKIEDVFAEIQRSNMSKLGEDGTPVFREDGKILKGPSYTPPDIAPILGL